MNARRMTKSVPAFPDFPSSFRGRDRETRVLSALIRAQHPATVALVGGGGSGKTTLATALGHRLRGHFHGRLFWLRIGDWDRGTVAELMALQLGARAPGTAISRLRRALGAADTLVILDNHESDAVTSRLLNDLRGLPVSWIITARRCLLGGVTLFPVVPALLHDRRNPFPAIAQLTRLLRWNPVALDLADAMVASGHCAVAELERRLRARHVDRVTVVAHEDDIPEVRAIVAEVKKYLPAAARRMLRVLAAMRGETMDEDSLCELARARQPRALEELTRSRLVQTPRKGRFTLHATVRHAIAAEGDASSLRDEIGAHYLNRFEASPDRMEGEDTQLFALMDWAQDKGDLGLILRVKSLADRRDEAG